jgi:GTP-binding protein Era
VQDLPSFATSDAAAINVSVALSKVDRITPRANILPIVNDVKQLLQTAPHCAIDGIFLLCALPGRGEGVSDLTRHLISRATLRPWSHPKDVVTTSAIESIVEDMVRERLFYHIRQEVPYACRVIVRECLQSMGDDGRLTVAASVSIVVRKSLHKVLA